MASPGARWVEGYMRAWRSNEPADIAALFTQDAVSEYDAQQFRGLPAITADWLRTADKPGDWDFEWWILAETDGIAIVRGITRYPAFQKGYDNLWEIHLAADGRASWFTEWYMERSEENA